MWEANVGVENHLVHVVLVLLVERWDTEKHFIEQDPEAPPICRLVVSISYDHFWREILRRAAEGIC